ncbi:hypothetical protein BJ912DRAFT_1055662 [Pholiota molesta]|nr:hypothetical protein BJ912DRAFT_1055662 [Pholiota molesta]
MSTSASTPTKHRFFVYAPDKTDEGALERRLSVRPQHLEGAKASHDNGLIRIGGMLTTPEAITNPDAPKHMVGSTFIFEAESIEQVKQYIESDIYYKAGVWDPEKIVVLPFFSAYPL